MVLLHHSLFQDLVTSVSGFQTHPRGKISEYSVTRIVHISKRKLCAKIIPDGAIYWKQMLVCSSKRIDENP